jgi:hypothetical protein
MVESSVRKDTNQNYDLESGKESFVLELGGTIVGSLGKIVLAVGSVGLLLYLFTQIEIIIGIGALYTGIATVGAGLVGMMLNNKLSNGYWFEGLIES